MKKHIFVSYAREDKEFARQLHRRLRESNRIPWQDLRNLRGGDYWQATIDEALRNAEALVVVMSPQATKSQYVTYSVRRLARCSREPVVRSEPHSSRLSITLHRFTTRRVLPGNLRNSLPARPSTYRLVEIRKIQRSRGQPEKQSDYFFHPSLVHKAPRAAASDVRFHDEPH